MTLYIIIGMVVVIAVIVFIVLNNYNKLKDLNNSLIAGEEMLLKTLNTKKDLLNKVKETSKNKELIKAMNFESNLNIFELEKTLFEVKWNLNKLINEKKYTPKKDVISTLDAINKTEEEIEGLKDYYNSKAITYNEFYYKKPFTTLYKLLKLEQKKTFSLRKIEDYEILKY